MNKNVVKQLQEQYPITYKNTNLLVNETVYNVIPLKQKLLYNVKQFKNYRIKFHILAPDTQLYIYLEYLINFKVRRFIYQWFKVIMQQNIQINQVKHHSEILIPEVITSFPNTDQFLKLYETDIEEISFSQNGVVFSRELFTELFIYPCWTKIQKLTKNSVVFDFVFQELFDLWQGIYKQ
eukprot:EST46337.1 Hypothetical protein SS50377_13648 [Spironucleus salmonicida]